MISPKYFIFGMTLASASCITNHPWRTTGGRTSGAKYPSTEHYELKRKNPDMKDGVPVGGSDTVKHTTCYVEFDEQGDFWNRRQLSNAVAEARKGGKPKLHFIYVHGWQNSAISRDVVKFNELMFRISRSVQSSSLKDFEVGGTYLAWRGSEYIHGAKVSKADYQYPSGDHSVARLEKNELDTNIAVEVATAVPKVFSYWSRDRTAKRMAGGPMAESVASVTEAVRRANPRSKVILIGHSMGALMIEKSIVQSITTHDFHNKEVRTSADLVLLLNSAATAISARETQEFFLNKGLAVQSEGKNVLPNIVSLTSETDRATGWIFPVGSHLGGATQRKLRGLYRDYENGEDQWAYDIKTPGHLGSLSTHTFRRVEGERAHGYGSTEALLFSGNLFAKGHFESLDVRKPGANLRVACSQRVENKDEMEWAPWEFAPIEGRPKTPYWIVRMPTGIMRSHGDIWNDNVSHIMVACLRAAGLSEPEETQRTIEPKMLTQPVQ